MMQIYVSKDFNGENSKSNIFLLIKIRMISKVNYKLREIIYKESS